MKEEKELTYGETIKQPFPKLEDIEWLKIEAPDMLNATREIAIGLTILRLGYEYQLMPNQTYLAIKGFYEKQNLFKTSWQLKQADPHADIKAEYEKAKEKYDVVKVFVYDDGEWKKYNDNLVPFSFDAEYQLRYYNIDWNKLLSWSYANGEFVECGFSDHDAFSGFPSKSTLRGITAKGKFANGGYSIYKYCRLAKGVEIKDEWLKEVK